MKKIYLTRSTYSWSFFSLFLNIMSDRQKEVEHNFCFDFKDCSLDELEFDDNLDRIASCDFYAPKTYKKYIYKLNHFLYWNLLKKIMFSG
jgi:hypothetical protein